MNRAALFLSLIASIALVGCGKSSGPTAPPTAAATKDSKSAPLELSGVELGRPLGSSPLAERLKKQNPTVGPHAESIAGSPILFSRVQLDASKNVEILYLKFDEEDYDRVKRALAAQYPFECKSGKMTIRGQREVDDELCIHTAAEGSLALRRRDQRFDTSSVGLLSAALGRPQLEGAFEDPKKQGKGI